MGSYGSQGTLASGHVTIPAYTWKVIVVLPAGSNDLSRVTTSTRVIAVVMPNNDSQISQSADWRNYRVTTDYIESMTGLDIMSAVPASIQQVIEARIDTL